MDLEELVLLGLAIMPIIVAFGIGTRVGRWIGRMEKNNKD